MTSERLSLNQQNGRSSRKCYTILKITTWTLNLIKLVTIYSSQVKYRISSVCCLSEHLLLLTNMLQTSCCTSVLWQDLNLDLVSPPDQRLHLGSGTGLQSGGDTPDVTGGSLPACTSCLCDYLQLTSVHEVSLRTLCGLLDLREQAEGKHVRHLKSRFLIWIFGHILWSCNRMNLWHAA